MAWLPGWTYRKSLSLSRVSGAVTNYQMRLKVGESSGATGEDVDCASHCKADFSDLRFTTADGTTLLDYYIELQTGTTPNRLATIWIEFNSIGTGATTFYMYYGKSDATAVSNGDDTFIFYEGFEDLTSAANLPGQGGWTGTAGKWSVETALPYAGIKGGRNTSGSDTAFADHALTGVTTYNVSIQAQLRATQINTSYQCGFYVYQVNSPISGMYLSTNNVAHLIAPPSWQNVIAASSNTWYKLRLDFLTASTHQVWVNDALQAPASNSNMNNVTTSINSIRIEQYTNGGTAYIDEIMVRKFLSTEPAWGSFGGEETGGGGGYPVLRRMQRARRAA